MTLAGVVAALEAFAQCSGLQVGDYGTPTVWCGTCAGCKARDALAALRSLPTNEELRGRVADGIWRWRTTRDPSSVESADLARIAIDVIATALGVGTEAPKP